MEEEYCDNCDRIIVDNPVHSDIPSDGYVIFCCKECASKYIIKNVDKFYWTQSD